MIWVQHGFRYVPWRKTVKLSAGAEKLVPVKLERSDLPVSFGKWRSADLHVHMNYGGTYRNTPANLARQARAEDLDAVYNLIVNKEERIPDIGYPVGSDAASNADTLIMHSQEFHTSYWGHLGLLHLSDHLLTPDFSAYQHTALASPYPYNGKVADMAHAQGALVGYVHPFDWVIDPAKEKSLSNELPADVINGKVDYIEIVGFADHRSTAEVWYRLLNLGFRLPAGAGTDAMANYASLRGPVGMNRVFLDTGGLLSPEAVELVQNGKVVKAFHMTGDRRKLDAAGELQIDSGGWLLLRAWNDGSDPEVLDIYPYATTSPIYLDLPGRPASAAVDAAYFEAWLDRVIAEAQGRTDFRNARERDATLSYLRDARNRFAALPK
jgi:hypothetical protein